MRFTLRSFVLAALTGALALIVLANLWVFSRFTVDDAFITWRYGRNLVEHGVWGYNPGAFDLTQAYTNPIYAALSILPAALGWDMVLSFKLLSLALLAGLAALMLRAAGNRARMGVLLLLMMAIPATVVHAFSGLETLLYAGALALAFIHVERGRWWAALAMVAILVLTRPEAWLLYALYPAAMLMAALWPQMAVPRPSPRMIVVHAALLVALGAGYFAFHLWQFGEVLPNTYFIKSGDGLSGEQALAILPYGLPALAVLAFGNRRTGLLMTGYFGVVGWSYASSDLLMNYLQRFPFHIVAPMALYLAWAVSRAAPRWMVAGVAAYLLGFALHTRSLGDHLGIANYYPRLLDSHVALGHALHDLAQDGRIAGFALGDAGAPAFHAGIRALDTIGLGSRRVAREGLTLEVVRAYAPDVVAFLADADGIRDLPERHAALWEYVAETGMEPRCEIVWARHYTLHLFSRDPLPPLQAACDHSDTANGAGELPYALGQLGRAPWTYWHE